VRLAGRVWPVAALFVLGLAGLYVRGPAGDAAAFVWLGVFPGLALARLVVPGAPPATRMASQRIPGKLEQLFP